MLHQDTISNALCNQAQRRVGLLLAALLAGCATPLTPGTVEGVAPPRLITIDGKAAWDNPAAFGPVPETLAATGEAVCSSLNTRWRSYRARGYHSRALDPYGNPFPRGAFYCQ